MPFSETIKVEVKKRAAFQCCRCKEIGVEVHHIIPQAKGGSDDIENAAPLCPTCHANFGGNPEKRKEIRQMRELWYQVVKEKYSNFGYLEKLNEKLIDLENKQTTTQTDIRDVKKMLNEFISKNEIELTDNIQSIKKKATIATSATTLANNVHANFNCNKCNTRIGLLIGSNNCPACHEPIGF